MKHVFAALTLIFCFASLNANAFGDHHSPDICSEQVQGLCAHVGYPTLNTTDAFKLMVHFTPGAGVDLAQLTNVSVVLWMDMGGHGHGSAPVKVRQLNADHFLVSEAYFPMQGEWQVRVKYTYAGQAGELVIPVNVP